MSIIKTTVTDPSISLGNPFDAFVLQTKNSTYSFDVINGFVNNSYWGKKIDRIEDIPLSVCPVWNVRGREEYPFFGGKFFHNEALKVTFPDNVRDTILKYEGFEINKENTRLIITLKDEVYPLRVKLYYDVFEELDIIDRYAEIINEGSDDILLETFYSAGITLPREEKNRLTYMGSGNVSEYRVKQCDIGPDTICVEAKAGISTFTNVPYFAIDDYTATEHSGDVRFGTLQWSGNWQIKVSKYHNTTKVVGGVSNFDCNVNLKGGDAFKTPIFTIGFSDEGFGKCNRMLHDYQRTTTLCPHINATMPVLYNAWSTFQFNIDEKLLFEQAQRCADLGIELFVIDDGWMVGRNNEKGGLGDWVIDPQKFPHGLQYVIDKVNAMGMKFGIWIEPEMVTEDSNLYKEHPDWILHYPTREREKERNQLILNFGREDVYQYTIKWIDKLLSENNIEYLKFDMNRRFSQAGWPDADVKDQRSVYIKYVENFYRLLAHINEKYPHVLIENCASGGLRTDLKMSKWCGRINRSDNQDPIDVLQLHEGFTKINLPKTAGGACHFHHTPNSINGRSAPMKFLAYVAYNGSLSVGYDLRKLNEEELEALKKYIAFYKEIRETTQISDMYVLNSAFNKESPCVSFQYVAKSKKKSVILVYSNNIGFATTPFTLKPKGLDPDKIYTVKVVENYGGWKSTKDMSGAGIMKIGLSPTKSTVWFKDAVYDAFAIILEEKGN